MHNIIITKRKKKLKYICPPVRHVIGKTIFTLEPTMRCVNFHGIFQRQLILPPWSVHGTGF